MMLIDLIYIQQNVFPNEEKKTHNPFLFVFIQQTLYESNVDSLVVIDIHIPFD
jgi:hypothetical protein